MCIDKRWISYKFAYNKWKRSWCQHRRRVRSVTYVKDEAWKHAEKHDYKFARYDKCLKCAVNGRNRNTIDMIADGMKCRHWKAQPDHEALTIFMTPPLRRFSIVFLVVRDENIAPIMNKTWYNIKNGIC